MSVKYSALRGGRLSWLEGRITSRGFRRKVPSIVLLNIGGNDLDSAEMRPQEVGLRLFECAHLRAVRLGTRQVAICQIVPRLSWRKVPTHVGNDFVAIINEFLEAVCDGHPNIFFWQHARLPKDSQPIMREDGVHFNDAGNNMLFRSFRGALLFAAKRH